MPSSFRVACIQVSASSNFDRNFEKVSRFVLKAVRKKARLITLPECFLWRGASRDLSEISLRTPKILKFFQSLARQHKTAFLFGSVLQQTGGNKFYNTSILINEKGKVAARYRKIHLFDIGFKSLKMNESQHIRRGKKVVVGKVFGISLGLSICYDLRFPELYRSLVFKGAKIIIVPANFTDYTGKAHWEVLLRARAIENQAFVIAPAQVGVNSENKIRSFGTSLIIDPWGKVLARGSRRGEMLIFADLKFPYQKELRRRFPALEHRVLDRIL